MKTNLCLSFKKKHHKEKDSSQTFIAMANVIGIRFCLLNTFECCHRPSRHMVLVLTVSVREDGDAHFIHEEAGSER